MFGFLIERGNRGTHWEYYVPGDYTVDRLVAFAIKDKELYFEFSLIWL